MFRLFRFSRALLLLLVVPLVYSLMGWMLSFRGVTAAEGTDDVGVLDLVPVVLGVAAAEDCPDSDISSWGHYSHTCQPPKHQLCSSDLQNALCKGPIFIAVICHHEKP